MLVLSILLSTKGKNGKKKSCVSSRGQVRRRKTPPKKKKALPEFSCVETTSLDSLRGLVRTT